MKRKVIVTVITLIVAIVATVVFLFVPQQRRDYSYLEEFPATQTFELNDSVVVENIDEVYYTYSAGVFYIEDVFDDSYVPMGSGALIFSYNGMWLTFDYTAEVVEVGSQNQHGQPDGIATVRITSTDSRITGSIIVQLKTRDMRRNDRIASAFPIYLAVCITVAVVEAVAFSAVSYYKYKKYANKKRLEDIEVQRRREREEQAQAERRQIIFDKYNPELSENAVYREFLNNSLGKLFTENNSSAEGIGDGGNSAVRASTPGKDKKKIKDSNKKYKWLNLENILSFLGCLLMTGGFSIAAIVAIFGYYAGFAWYALIPAAGAIAGIFLTKLTDFE